MTLIPPVRPAGSVQNGSFRSRTDTRIHDGVRKLAELTPTKPTDEATDTTVGTAGTSIAGMLCEGRFALYLAGEPYKSGLKAQGCGKLKKAVFSIELDPDEEETEE